MPVGRKTFAALLLAGVSVGGYLFVTQLPALVHQYQQAREFSPVWGYIYLGVLLLSAAAALALVGWGGWLLVRASSEKRRRRLAENRQPSQMTLAQQSAEVELHLADVERLAEDPSLPAEVRAPLRHSLSEIRERRAGQKLEIVAFGTVSSGKSSLLNALGRARDLSDRSQGRHHHHHQRNPLAGRRSRAAGRYAGPGRSAWRGRENRSPGCRPAMPTWCCWSSTVRSRISSTTCWPNWHRWKSAWCCA